jgi:hypothetical protein
MVMCIALACKRSGSGVHIDIDKIYTQLSIIIAKSNIIIAKLKYKVQGTKFKNVCRGMQ